MRGKVLVDPIIAHQSFSAQSFNDTQDPENFSRADANHLLYGQRAVTQQTNARFVKYVQKIEVLTDPAPKWNAPTVTPVAGVVEAGTEVEMHAPFDDEDKVHYTIDGSDPTIDSLMYNWVAKRWWSSRSDDLNQVNHKIPINSDTTIKAVVIGPGRSDSDIVTNEYLVPFGSAGKGDMVYVAGRNTHTVAIKNDGTLWAWGNGHQGKLGDGNTGSSYWKSTPVQVSGLTEVTAAAPGYNHTLALKNDGTVWAWGSNQYGELGIGVSGTFENRTVPEQVYGMAGVQAIAAGDSFSLALKNDGTVWTWGRNDYGQLGIGVSGSAEKRTVAEQVYGLTGVQKIAAGKEFCLALKSDGTVWAWGRNNEGQLGDGTQTNSNVPVQFTALTGVFKDIAAGQGFSFAIKEDGTAWGWGFASSGQLGNKDLDLSKIMRSLVPVQASDLTDVKAITAGDNHTMALQNDGSLWVWGNNAVGQLGNGKKGYGDNASKIPVKLYGPEAGIAMINAGSDYSQALKNDGTAWAWGSNTKGKLGDGTISQYGERLVPTQVKRAPVTLTPAAAVVAPGEAVDLTFTDDANWRESVTSVIMDNKGLSEFDYTVSTGKITINAGVLAEAGEYNITVKSAGYVDSVATVQVQAQLAAPPTLAADTTDNTVGQPVDITFTDDPAWRAAITGITVAGNALTTEQYTVTEGNINITADVFTLAGDYQVVVSATGYEDATVTQTVKAVAKIVFTIDGNVVDTPLTYTLEQLQAMTPTSVLDSKNRSYKGVAINDLLAALGTVGSDWTALIKIKDGNKAPANVSTYSGYVLAYERDGVAFNDNLGAETMHLQLIFEGGGNIKYIYGMTIDKPVSLTPPALTADSTDNEVGQNITLSFTDDEAWRSAITGVTVDGADLASDKYTVSAGQITMAADVFTAAKDYNVVVKAGGYEDATVVQALRTASTPNPVYTVTPEADGAYTVATQNGISTMTVNAGVTGFKYFSVNIAPVVSHSGNETVVFSHFRNGSQLGLNATRADFDLVTIAQAGFNVHPEELIKVYIVDDLTNAVDFNPTVLQ